jgi:hypothetical protein
MSGRPRLWQTELLQIGTTASDNTVTDTDVWRRISLRAALDLYRPDGQHSHSLGTIQPPTKYSISQRLNIRNTISCDVLHDRRVTNYHIWDLHHVVSNRFHIVCCLDRTVSLACSHSEFILKLWILWTAGRIPWTGDQPVTGLLSTQDNTDTHSCFEWDSNYDPSVGADENGSYFRPCGHCDRYKIYACN